MTVLSRLPNERYSHAGRRTRLGDPEPLVEELLDDPIVQALMARDGVTRPALEALIARLRRRLGPGDDALYASLEAKLLLDCD